MQHVVANTRKTEQSINLNNKLKWKAHAQIAHLVFANTQKSQPWKTKRAIFPHLFFAIIN